MLTLTKHFAAIGAQLDVIKVAQIGRGVQTYDLDVHGRGREEHFELRVTSAAPAFHVLHVDRATRHLLLHAQKDYLNERFLCGHDERHWFAAAIADRVSTVTDARGSLLPDALRHMSLTPDILATRSNFAFKRQGEWFFVPVSGDLRLQFATCYIHRNQPLVRQGGGKPHLCEEEIRLRGTSVQVLDSREVSDAEIEKMSPMQKAKLRLMVKDAEVYVRGSIRHPDHATLILDDWHRVYPNREARSRNLSFYD